MPRVYSLSCILLLCLGAALAKDEPAQVLIWPASGNPVLRFTFGKFRESSSSGKLRYYTTDTAVENLWSKPIASAQFSLYLFDKSKARIGEGLIMVTNVRPGEVVRFRMGIESSGNPVSLSIAPQTVPAELQAFMPPAPARTISLTVNSIPQGADLKVDGQESGTTPHMIRLSAGKHILEFSKAGFTPGTFPIEIGPDDANGGSVSYELGTSAHDTLELRDGSVLVGDLESMSATEVVIRIGGDLQHLNRNSVKRILLTERDMPGK